jgi:hypothetical protein
MARQYNIPGIGYLNETTSLEFLIPGSVYINESQGSNLTVAVSDTISILDAVRLSSSWVLNFGDQLNILDDVDLPSTSRYSDAVLIELLSLYDNNSILRIRRYLGDLDGIYVPPDGEAASPEVEVSLGGNYNSEAIDRIRRYLGDIQNS